MLFFHLFLLSKTIFTAWPEMLSYPYLFSNGYLLYKDLIAPYTPGLIITLSAVFNIFGYSVEVLKNFSWILIILSDISFFILIKSITKDINISLFFLFLYIILQTFFDGNMLWFDFTTVLPLIWAIYFYLNWLNKKETTNIFLSSLFFGLAIFIKQIAVIYFAGFLFYYFIIWEKKYKELYKIILGVFLVFIPFLIYLLSKNILIDFLNWTLIYPVFYWKNFPGYIDYEISKTEALAFSFLFSISIWTINKYKIFIKDQRFIFLLIMFICTLLATFPRFSFFHLQPALAISLITASIVIMKINHKYLFATYLLMAVFIIFLLNSKNTFNEEIRFYTKKDISFTSKLKEELKDEKLTYFLGFNSTQYVFTKTFPPKPWIEGFGWYMESPGVQYRVVSGLEHAKPQAVFVKKPKDGDWFDLESYQPKEVKSYILDEYYYSGIIDGEIEIWRRKKE